MPQNSILRRCVLSLAVLGCLMAGSVGAAMAQEAETESEDGSNDRLPLPRFVSFKAERVNLRVGPGRDYPIAWLYTRRGLPVEIIQEFEQWRRVRDAEGSEGWVYYSLLSGNRTAIASPWLKGKPVLVDMHRSATAESGIVARLEPGVIAKVDGCSFGWCEAEVSGRKGFIAQNELWGVYPDEKF